MVCDRLRKTLSRSPSTSSSTTSNGIPAAVRLRVAASSASRRGSVGRSVAMAPVLPRRRRSVPPAPPRDEHRDPDEGDHDEHDEEHAPTLMGPGNPRFRPGRWSRSRWSRRRIRRCSPVIHPNTRGPGAGRGQEGQAQSGDAEASGAIVGRGQGALDSPGGAGESAGAEVHHDRPGPLRAHDARGGAGTRRGRRAVSVGVDPADRGGGTGSRGGRRARCRCHAARARHRAGRALAR